MKKPIDKDAFDFGHRLQELRQARGLTQEEVANRLGLHTKTISAYENNDRFPKYEILKKLATLYNASTDYILNHDKRTSLYLDDLPPTKQKLIVKIFEAIRTEYEEESD